MNTYKCVYIAIDLHSNHSMVGYMNDKGKYIGQRELHTTPENLIGEIAGIPAERKELVIEQSNMAFAMAQKLRGYTDRLVVCDPRHNKLISQSANKNDGLDTQRLCRLLRLNEIKPVWVPETMGRRRLLLDQVKSYHRLSKMLTVQKNQLQAKLRHWGINKQVSGADYQDPSGLLDGLSQEGLAAELQAKMEFIGDLAARKADQMKRVTQTGEQFWEIAEFQKMTGIGPVGAHTFSAYIQTPHRFPGRSQLIRYCQLGVAKRSSDGTLLGRESLDKAGHSRLKQVSYVAWETAQKTDNEISGFYRASLERSSNSTNARLNTQRKILTTLWNLWKHERTYRPEKFYSDDGNSAQ